MCWSYINISKGLMFGKCVKEIVAHVGPSNQTIKVHDYISLTCVISVRRSSSYIMGSQSWSLRWAKVFSIQIDITCWNGGMKLSVTCMLYTAWSSSLVLHWFTLFMFAVRLNPLLGTLKATWNHKNTLILQMYVGIIVILYRFIVWILLIYRIMCHRQNKVMHNVRKVRNQMIILF